MWLWAFLILVIVIIYYRGKFLFKTGLISNHRTHGPGESVFLSYGKTHYYLQGPKNGEVVLFLHGYSIPTEIYLDIGIDQYYINAGFRFLTLDFYGRGYSDAPDTRYTPSLLVGQIAELLYVLGINEPVNVIGLSMGGGVASYFTMVYPNQVKKLILLSSIGYNIKVPKIAMQMVQIPWIGEMVYKNIGKTVLYKSFPSEWVDPVKNEDYEKCFNRVKKHVEENEGLVRTLFLTLKFFPLNNISDILSEVAKLKKKSAHRSWRKR